MKAVGGKLNDSSFFDDDKIDTIPEDPKVRRTLSSKPSMIKPKTFAFDESSIQLNQMFKESSLGPAGCKTTKNGDSRLKKIKAENRQLREQIKKLKELVSSDKVLKQMKQEYNECMTECKQILEHLENKVQQTLLEEIVGGEQQNALMDLLENTRVDAFDAGGGPH